MLLNNGDGTFQSPQALADDGTVVNAYSLAAADVNGDGKPTIAVGTAGHTYYYGSGSPASINYDSRVAVLLDDQGSITEHSLVGGESADRDAAFQPLQVAVANLNGDGKADVVYGRTDGSVTAELENGDGTFTNALALPSVSGPAVPFGGPDRQRQGR